MTRQIALVAAVAMLSLTLAANAGAQAQVMPHFGISAGASIPESTFGEAVNTGYNVNGMINMSVPLSPIGFRGEVGWNRFDVSSSSTSGNVDVINGTLNVVLTPSAVMTAKPYLIAGVGAYRVKGSFAPALGGDALISSGSNTTRMGVNGGIGLMFGLGPIGAIIEARYVSVGGKNGGGSLTYIPVSFGVTF